ncbi:hypothetical protein B0H16DRAFT_1878471 [Mycena metata]|uniref:Uncharacterized protein n=1 Tax=Mycena metata TaxID=1033252 RepID=A0AAD7NXG9_9AGAR|nr:hypothetical protein B0H16DRAFT_1878471 [Mycena metata]
MHPRRLPSTLSQTIPTTSPVTDINAKSFSCPKPFCGRAIKLKLETNGRHAGRFLLNCYALHQDAQPYVYHFPKNVQPSSLAQSTNPTLAQSTNPTPGISALAKVAHISTGCVSRATLGDCLVHRAVSAPLRPQPMTAPALLLPRHASPFTALAHTAAQFTPVPRFIEQVSRDSHREALRREAEEAAFMTSISSPIISQEEQDYQLAVMRSLSSSSPSSPVLPSTSSTALENFHRHTFNIVEWLEDGQPAVVKCIQDLPTWPYWTRDGDDAYQCYSADFSTWMDVRPNHAHNISCGLVLVRRAGVTSPDEANFVSRLAVARDPPLLLPQVPERRRTSTRKRQRAPSAEVIEILSTDDETPNSYKPLHRARARVIKRERITPPPKRVRGRAVSFEREFPYYISIPSPPPM